MYGLPHEGIIPAFYYSGGISGSNDPGCQITRSDPVPETHGGLEAGTVIQGWSSCQTLEAILFPYQYPSFTSFYINGQSTQLEIGEVVTGGIRDFRWSTTNDTNIVANSISISDITENITLGSGLANDGQENLDIGSDKTETTPGATHTWQITGQNTKGGTFSRNFSVRWLARVYWGYSDDTTITETEILNAENSALKTGYAGDYNFTNPGNTVYYFVAYPDGFGDFNTWINSDNNFGIDYTQEANVDVTNAFGVTVTYRVYRTTYAQNGDLNSTMS